MHTHRHTHKQDLQPTRRNVLREWTAAAQHSKRWRVQGLAKIWHPCRYQLILCSVPPVPNPSPSWVTAGPKTPPKLSAALSEWSEWSVVDFHWIEKHNENLNEYVGIYIWELHQSVISSQEAEHTDVFRPVRSDFLRSSLTASNISGPPWIPERRRQMNLLKPFKPQHHERWGRPQLKFIKEKTLKTESCEKDETREPRRTPHTAAWQLGFKSHGLISVRTQTAVRYEPSVTTCFNQLGESGSTLGTGCQTASRCHTGFTENGRK